MAATQTDPATTGSNISVLVVPDMDPDAPYLDALAAKYRDWRIEVLSLGVEAFGATPFEVEQNRTLDWYKKQLADPSVVLAVGVEHPSSSSNELDRLLNGRWFGSTSHHWPIPESAYTMPTHPCNLSPNCPQERSRNGNAFVLPAYRHRKDASGSGFLKSMLHQATLSLAEKVRAKHPGNKTIYLRMMNSVGPQAIQNPKVLWYFEKIAGFVPTGRVPEVVTALLNETPVQKWPSPDENPGYYRDCWWTIGERIIRVDEVGYAIVTREVLNDKGSKL